MFAKWLLFLFTSTVGLCVVALGACPEATVGSVSGSTQAVRLGEKIFSRTSGLELDFDGNPHAYGVRDQGQENICVGLAP